MDLSAFETWENGTGSPQVVIETPKGSRNKFAYDPRIGAFRLTGMLPAGNTFPFDFGFFPSTLGGDGDPLDVLVLLDEGVNMGTILTVRLLGGVEAEQTEGSQTVRNDRLIAVAVHSHTHQHETRLKDLRPSLVDEIAEFYVNYHRFRGSTFTPIGNKGPKTAAKLLAAAAKRYKRQARAR